MAIEGRKTQGAQLAGGRLSKLIWGSGDGKKRVRCHATTERALRYPTGIRRYQVSLSIWEMGVGNAPTRRGGGDHAKDQGGLGERSTKCPKLHK